MAECGVRLWIRHSAGIYHPGLCAASFYHQDRSLQQIVPSDERVNALTQNELPPARAWAGRDRPKQCPWCFFGEVLPKAGFYEIITANHGADRVVSPATLLDS